MATCVIEGEKLLHVSTSSKFVNFDNSRFLFFPPFLLLGKCFFTADETSASIVIKQGVVDENTKNCDTSEEAIEQGTDMLDPSLDLGDLEGGEGKDRLVEGGGDEVEGGVNGEKQEVSLETDIQRMDYSQSELLEKWMKNGTSSECCSNEGSLVQTCQNFSEISVNAVQSVDSPLMARTDALLTTKSFNLVKPKPNL